MWCKEGPLSIWWLLVGVGVDLTVAAAVAPGGSELAVDIRYPLAFILLPLVRAALGFNLHNLEPTACPDQIQYLTPFLLPVAAVVVAAPVAQPLLAAAEAQVAVAGKETLRPQNWEGQGIRHQSAHLKATMAVSVV
jgi:hypothetical protein